jgi:hypothetical protein
LLKIRVSVSVRTSFKSYSLRFRITGNSTRKVSVSAWL